MKCRTIPFGYKVEHGLLIAHNEESMTVKAIFDKYCEGLSYLQIADILSAGNVFYHTNSSIWNKNMIKRILENNKYVGKGEYPAIVTNEQFEQVENIKKSKQVKYGMPPEHFKILRETICCGHCGSSLYRKHINRLCKWLCPICATAVSDDKRTISGILDLLNRLVATPSIIEIPPVNIGVSSTDINRLTAEINRATDNQGCDERLVINMIYSAAQEKYNCFDSCEAVEIAREMRRTYSTLGKQTELDMELYKLSVLKIGIKENGGFMFTLRNGQNIAITQF